MNNFYPAATIILSEICIALLALGGIMIFTTMRNRRRRQNALSQLAEKIKQDEAERLASLKSMLKDTYHYADGKIEETAASIVKAEMSFYQGLMNTFSSRDGTSLENLDRKMNSVIDVYRNLAPQGNPGTDTDTPAAGHNSDPGNFTDEIAHLKDENEKLTQKLEAIKAATEETNIEFIRTFAGRLKDDVNISSPADDAIITADNPENAEAEPATKADNPEETATPGPAVSAKDAAPQNDTPLSPGQDDDDDTLGNSGITPADLNLDANSADALQNNPASADNAGDDKTDTAANNVDTSGLDETPNDAPDKAGPDNMQEGQELTPAKKGPE